MLSKYNRFLFAELFELYGSFTLNRNFDDEYKKTGTPEHQAFTADIKALVRKIDSYKQLALRYSIAIVMILFIKYIMRIDFIENVNDVI